MTEELRLEPQEAVIMRMERLPFRFDSSIIVTLFEIANNCYVC